LVGLGDVDERLLAQVRLAAVAVQVAEGRERHDAEADHRDGPADDYSRLAAVAKDGHAVAQHAPNDFEGPARGDEDAVGRRLVPFHAPGGRVERVRQVRDRAVDDADRAVLREETEALAREQLQGAALDQCAVFELAGRRRPRTRRRRPCRASPTGCTTRAPPCPSCRLGAPW